jgi:hypothetical protein
MSYWVKRILLKTGELVTEKELLGKENFFQGPAPVVGDKLFVTCRNRTFEARVIWGNWPNRNANDDPTLIVPIRVEEI